jgi:voltage-gated potassium channel Kch
MKANFEHKTFMASILAVTSYVIYTYLRRLSLAIFLPRIGHVWVADYTTFLKEQLHYVIYSDVLHEYFLSIN